MASLPQKTISIIINVVKKTKKLTSKVGSGSQRPKPGLRPRVSSTQPTEQLNRKEHITEWANFLYNLYEESKINSKEQ